jgi:hypothetical protein
VIRDPGPIQSLGNGLTSRDVPFQEGETTGTPSNSGYIASALNGHPVMRFFAHTATSLAVAGVLAGVTKKGGIKLATKIQDRADAGSQFSTRLVKSITDIRRELDQLQGITRNIDGVDGDAYSRLVLQDADGKYTTGYRSRIGERHGYGYFTQEELNQAGRGLTGEPAAIWSWRDELQQRLVRAGRRLPYELPALYAGQRLVTDTLFGENGNSNVNWYNPVDVITDFTQQSVKNLATAIIPFEFGGAALSQGRNSLHSLRYTYNDLNALNPVQKSVSKNFLNLENLLQAVGHDMAKMTDNVLKRSIQTSGALSSAANAMDKQKGFVQNLRSLYTSSKRNYDDANILSGLSSASKSKAAFNAASKIFFPNTDDVSFFDLFPGLNGIGKAFSAGREQFKLIGHGYDASKSAIAFNETLARMQNQHYSSPYSKLQEAVQSVQKLHGSRLSKASEYIIGLGNGGPGSFGFTQSDFYESQKQTAAKQLIVQELKRKTASKNIDEQSLTNFVNSLSINKISQQGADTSKIVSFGKSKILSADDNPSDYFNQIIQRYRQDKDGQDLFAKFFDDPSELSSALEQSVERARSIFTNKQYQRGLESKIINQWTSFMNNSSITAGTLLKPKKAQYSDYTGPLTGAKQEFLQKKSAQLLGIPLMQQNGQSVSQSLIVQKLAREGFNPSDPMYFQNLRSFLIKNKKMSSGIMSGNVNIFGLESLTFERAYQEGIFDHTPDRQKNTLLNLAARMSSGDPVNKSIETRPLGGVYKSSGGQVLDFTKVKSTFANIADFFADEFKIPILGFNPADLFGHRSFKEMAKRSPIQYVSGSSIQPFGAARNDKSDFYIWHRKGGFRGTKGKVTAFKTGDAGDIFAETFEGTYRAVPTKSSDMLTRVARFAAGFRGATIDQIRADLTGNNSSGSRFLDRILGEDRAMKFKKALDIDSEQPNSLFGLADRFIKRGRDINNPIVLSKLLRGEEVSYKSGGKSKILQLSSDANGALNVIDEVGEVVYGQEKIIRSYHALRKQLGTSKIDKKVIEQLDNLDPGRFALRMPGGASIKVSELKDLKSLEEAAEQILGSQRSIIEALRSEGVSEDYSRAVSSSISALGRAARATESSTIVSRQEELRSRIFDVAMQSGQARRMLSGSFGDDFIYINEIVDQMARTGQISKSQKSEAKAAALLGMFNFNAAANYSARDSIIKTEAKVIQNLRDQLYSNEDMKRILDVVTSGELARPTGPITERFSAFLPGIKRTLGPTPFMLDELSIDPLGTNQGTTLVPTFGTIFSDPNIGGFRALKSALGFTTYSDPEAYSGASVPVAHGIERLNRYFGTLGMQLDVNKYQGPLDLFARGMVGKRVLPAYAAGLGFMTLDRTAGGMLAGTDPSGERIYSPLVMGQVGKAAIEAQAFVSGMFPGGMTYQEKREQLLEGEVPIRRGRFWPLSNTPFMGEEVMYYSPSWYRRMQGAAGFTSETMGSPIERALFYTDISPLRPFDPYRFERKNYETRPYPVTGEYFTGPFGPLVPLANMTIGRLLKPQKMMHEEILVSGLSNYAIAGQMGAYDASGYLGVGSYSQVGAYQDPRYARSPAVTPRGLGYAGSGPISSYNQNMQEASMQPAFTAGNISIANISGINQNYIGMAYGAPQVSGVMPPKIVGSGLPIMPMSTSFQAGELGFRSQEMLGIYGFGFGAIRGGLGFGDDDFRPQRSVLQAASAGYSSTRDFWSLHLGGLGDVPLSVQGPLGNIEFSEIVRRFIPKERTGIDYINPIPNLMGTQYLFLPGPEYFNDFTRGDPFQEVPRGEIRLPGVGYERMNRLYSDEFGRYGLLDQYKILSDVAPYSQQFKALDQSIDAIISEPYQKIRLQELRSRLSETTRKNNFADYKYEDQQVDNPGFNPALNRISRIGEFIAHSDNFIVQKFGGKNTATEDWERKNVYGTSFPEWQRPVDSYLEPLVYKATQKNPILAMGGLAVVGGAFGRTSRAKIGGAFLGATIGGVASGYGAAYEAFTGDRFIPKREREKLALEEYADILEYVKQTRLAGLAEVSGDAYAANQYRSAASRTMYGANIYSQDPETLSLSVPKRKREHFMAMLNAPVGERERILSTSGRLERRLYQAAWGMDIEAKPDLVEYFSRHELPDASWEGWHPNTSMESVKIKMGQSMGIEMSQMGYYPQQIKEANLLNPSYPEFGKPNSSQDQLQKLRQLLSTMGLSGTITPTYGYSGSSSIQVSAGVF